MFRLLLLSCFFVVSMGAQEWHFQTKQPKQSSAASQKEEKKETSATSAPSWMKERIEKELAPFRASKITSKKIDRIWNERGAAKTAQYVRFIYKNGELHSFLADITDPEMWRFESVKGALQRLNKKKPLPDFDLMVTLHDEYSGSLPIFTFAKDKNAPGGILMPDCEALLGYDRLAANILAASHQYPWQVKLRMAFWRGSSTGGAYTLNNWESKPRAQLVLHSIYNPREIDARFTSLVQTDDAAWMYLSAHGFLGMPASQAEHLRYKYLIEVDGNSCSYSRCYWQLLSNSVMLKQVSNNIQWYYDAMHPYQHFIPLASDLSDVLQMLYWAKSHDSECKEIAQQATEFAKTELSKESIDLYLRLLLEEYSKNCDVSVKD